MELAEWFEIGISNKMCELSVVDAIYMVLLASVIKGLLTKVSRVLTARSLPFSETSWIHISMAESSTQQKFAGSSPFAQSSCCGDLLGFARDEEFKPELSRTGGVARLVFQLSSAGWSLLSCKTI